MEKISFFLEKFKTLGGDSIFLKSEFIRIVREVTKVEIAPAQVELRGPALYVKTLPALKSELYLKKNAILSELSKTIKNRKVEAVR